MNSSRESTARFIPRYAKHTVAGLLIAGFFVFLATPVSAPGARLGEQAHTVSVLQYEQRVQIEQERLITHFRHRRGMPSLTAEEREQIETQLASAEKRLAEAEIVIRAITRHTPKVAATRTATATATPIQVRVGETP